MSIYKIYSIKKTTYYQKKKTLARALARDWQQNLATLSHSWQWTVNWYFRWERIGKKYGLLKEFRENGIL